MINAILLWLFVALQPAPTKCPWYHTVFVYRGVDRMADAEEEPGCSHCRWIYPGGPVLLLAPMCDTEARGEYSSSLQWAP